MSGLEVPAFIIGVAGLFSSCVDAFAYFKVAQRAGQEVEVVLLKLDIEKARLLIWAENVGLFSTSRQDRWLLDEGVMELTQRILSQVKDLLTDSETLRTSYGVRALDTLPHKAVDYVSSKSLAVFRTTASRFWTRNASKLNTKTHGNILLKTKWAIYEREKFQALVNDLSHFVDKLFELFEVAREVQDNVIIEDIESILDVSQLKLIEEATEDSYRAYSQAAASVRALTEAGTVDRRTLEEHLRDVEGPAASKLHTGQQALKMNDTNRLWSEVKFGLDYVVLTSKCKKLPTLSPCDVRQLGFNVGGISNSQIPYWDVSTKNEKCGSTLGQLINRLIDIRSRIIEEEDGVLGEILKERKSRLSRVQAKFIQSRLPLVDLFIHCAPCVCLLHTALSIGKRVSSPFVEVHVRPDDRLISSCCAKVNRTLGLRSILEWVRGWESRPFNFESNYLASFLDRVWLDRRLDHLEYERPFDYKQTRTPNTKVLLIGEADYLGPLVQKTPGRIPKATDIWEFPKAVGKPLTRHLFSRFNETQSATIPRAPQSQMPAISAQAQAEVFRVGRPSSPVASDSKRRKLEAMMLEGSEAKASEHADTESQSLSSESQSLSSESQSLSSESQSLSSESQSLSSESQSLSSESSG